MSISTTDHAAKCLRAITEAARRLHPELGLSFGYVGNMLMAPKEDDRRWSVFAKLSDRREATGCNVSWGSAATAELSSLAVCATLGDVFDWADRQSVLLHDGKLFQVNPTAWVETELAYARAWPQRTRLAAGL